jgi:serine/threonine protein kinase
MLERIEHMHNNNFIHRDIKPENFCIGGPKKQNMVYILDFGLSKRYMCPKTGDHITHKKKSGITGTPRYCSLNAMNYME